MIEWLMNAATASLQAWCSMNRVASVRETQVCSSVLPEGKDMKKLIGIGGIGALFVTAFAATAMLATTFDPSCSLQISNWGPCGFVGKGDLQTPWDWNNATMNANASGVTFVYSQEGAWKYDCEWFTGPANNRIQHRVTHNLGTTVSSEVQSEVRKGGGIQNVTGFKLVGGPYAPSGGGDMPEAIANGAPCPGYSGNGATVVPGSQTNEGTVEALYGRYPGQDDVLLWPVQP